jgi:hypothetical protein
VALVTSTPWAGAMTALVSGSVGSTQWRRQAASTDAAVHQVGVEPVDEVGVVLGVLVDGLQHGAPGGELHARAAIEPSQSPFNPRAFGGAQGLGLGVHQVLERAGQRQQRRLDLGERGGGDAGGLAHEVQRRARGALHADLGGGGPGAQLLQHGDQEVLDRAGGVHLAVGGRDAAAPALARQGGGGVQGRVEVAPRLLRPAQDVEQARLEAAAAAAAPLGAADPAAQLGGLLAGERGGEGAVGGVEQVVALVEDDALELGGLGVALGAAGRAGAVEGGLGHDQGVVGDDEVGAAARADRLLHEAGAVVLAAGVDAFAAAVDEVGGGGLGLRRDREQGRQPGGEVAAGHVAVAGGAGPAGGERHADQVGAAELGGVGLLLEVQEAQVVLAALAHDRLLAAHGLVGVDRAGLALDLALEGAGVGGDPDGRAVGLGPQGGGREVAQGLADPGAGLGQHHIGFALAVARREDEGGFGGVVGLGGAGLVEAGGLQEGGQAGAGVGGVDRLGAGLAGRGLGLPFGEARPDVEAGGAELVAGGLGAERADHRGAPGPAGAGEGFGEGEGFFAAGRGVVGEVGQQGVGGELEGLGLLLGGLGFGEAEGLGEAGGRGGGELGGAGEGEELKGVEDAGAARRGVEAEAPRGHAGVGEEDGGGFEEVAGVGGADGAAESGVGGGGAVSRPGGRGGIGHGAARPGEDDEGGERGLRRTGGESPAGG